MDSETVDSDWAQDAERSISTAVTTAADEVLGDAKLAYMSCRTSICVVDVEHDDNETFADFAGNMRNVEGFSRVFSHREGTESGSGRSTHYFFREGHAFPEGTSK
jgi:hypothetical protein